MKSPDVMSAAEINHELDKLDTQRSKANRALIDAGRGHERFSETAAKTDPLAVVFNTIADRQYALSHEIERRCGPGAPSRLPLRQCFGPIGTNARKSKRG